MHRGRRRRGCAVFTQRRPSRQTARQPTPTTPSHTPSPSTAQVSASRIGHAAPAARAPNTTSLRPHTVGEWTARVPTIRLHSTETLTYALVRNLIPPTYPPTYNQVSGRPVWRHAVHSDRWLAFDGARWLCQLTDCLGQSKGMQPPTVSESRDPKIHDAVSFSSSHLYSTAFASSIF